MSTVWKVTPIKDLLGQLRNPPREFTPVPFWFFNDTFDRERISAQLEDYVEKGVNALVLHPRIGIPEDMPYLSDAYFEMVRFVVEKASRLDMKIVLYDEGMYPSGSAHGMVAAADPSYRAKGITITREPGPDPVIARLSGGRYLVRRATEGTIRGIHFGEDDGEKGAPAAADILNPKAVALFIHLTHDRYYEELKDYFGNTVIGFFTDEPCALGRNAEAFREWADGMEKEIIDEGGCLKELEGLFTGEENATTAIYHRLIKKHLREIFYGALSRWCEEHGIWLMGHPAESDDVEEELYFHVPGQDLIMRRVSPETGGLLEADSVQAKLAADIARHLGRRRNSNECFGVCCREKIPWYFTGKDMKWYLNWMGIRGVNLFIPHAFYYSVGGKRKQERPPDVGPNNIWWRHYRYFSDYMKRLSFLMTDSVNGAKVAVLCDNNRIPFREIAALYEHQIEFNYLPAALLRECRTENGMLCIRDYRYEAVLNLLGGEYDNWIREGKECGAATENGGAVERGGGNVEKAPAEKSSPAKATSTVRIVHEAQALITEERRAIRTRSFSPDLRVAHLYKEGTELYHLSNEGKETIRTQILIPGGEDILCVNLWKAAVCPAQEEQKADGAELSLELRPCEMLLLINHGREAYAKCIGPEAHAESNGPEERERKREAGEGSDASEMPISATADPAGNRAQAENWNDRFTLKSREENRAEYVYGFHAEALTGDESFEVTGEEMAECWCNGAFAGVSFYSPHRFEVGPHLREGENEILLAFTGNAANQYDNAGLFFGLGRNHYESL